MSSDPRMCVEPSFRYRILASTVAVLALAQAGATAQTVIASFTNLPTEHLGARLAPIADLDGDGISDFVLARETNASPTSAVSVVVLSGASGAILQSHGDPADWQYYGAAIATLGDLDHDGFEDFAVGVPIHSFPPKVPRVLVFSGHTGAQILNVPNPTGTATGASFGSSLAGLGDVDSDGTPDLLIGDTGTTMNPFTVVSGATGSVIYGLGQANGIYLAGSGIAPIGDSDLDGVVDYAVQVVTYPSQNVLVELHSGATGAKLQSHPKHSASSRIGDAICAAGDVDLDGRPDFAVSERSLSSPNTAGGVYVYSGGNSAQLSLVKNPFVGASLDSFFAYSLAGGFDVSGDAPPDIVIGSPFSWTSVIVADAATGKWNAAFATPSNGYAGWSTAIVPDRSGDGIAEIADSWPNPASAFEPNLRVRKVDKTSVEPFGFHCAGSGGAFATLSGSVVPNGAQETIGITVSAGLGGAPCAILASLPGLAPLNSGCGVLFLSPLIQPLVVFATLSGSGPGNGTLSAAGNVNPGFGVIALQVAIADPGAPKSLSLTNAIVVKG